MADPQKKRPAADLSTNGQPPHPDADLTHSGKSFQAAPTGLPTDADTDAERFATGQGSATSRPAWTPGPPETIEEVGSPVKPRGMISMVLLLMAVILAGLALLYFVG